MGTLTEFGEESQGKLFQPSFKQLNHLQLEDLKGLPTFSWGPWPLPIWHRVELIYP